MVAAPSARALSGLSWSCCSEPHAAVCCEAARDGDAVRERCAGKVAALCTVIAAIGPGIATSSQSTRSASVPTSRYTNGF